MGLALLKTTNGKKNHVEIQKTVNKSCLQLRLMVLTKVCFSSA